MRVRLGLIGLGRIGVFHARTLADLPVVESLVVTDAVSAVTAEVADRVGAEECDSPEQLLTAGVDGVLIAAATDAHPTLIRAAVDAGLPVFCEKPIAHSIEEAVAVQQYVEAAGLPVQIGYPRRFDTAFQAARDAVASWAGFTRFGRQRSTRPHPPPRM
jgi:myo-inositol 2-dehydrogenase / D-chiro-inositol 1-dehydrogenase